MNRNSLGVLLWQPEGSLFQHELKVPNAGNWFFRDLDWSPDGKRMAAHCSDNYVRIWNTDTGEMQHSIQHTDFEGLAWTPDNKTLTLCGKWRNGHAILFVDATTGKHQENPLYLDAQSTRGARLDWSKSGDILVAMVFGGGIRSFDMDASKFLAGVDEVKTQFRGWRPEGGFTFRIPSTWRTPHHQLDEADYGHPSFMLWDSFMGDVVWRTSNEPSWGFAHWSSDGRYLATAYRRQVSVCQDGVLGNSFNTEQDVRNVVWDDVHRRIAFAAGEEILMWDPFRDKVASRIAIPEDENISFVIISPLGKLWLGSRKGKIHQWNESNSTYRSIQLHKNGEQVDHISFSPDGALFASRTGWSRVTVASALTGEVMRGFSGLPGVKELKWADQLLCYCDNGTIRAWDPVNDLIPTVKSKTFAKIGHSGSFSPSGGYLAAGKGA